MRQSIRNLVYENCYKGRLLVNFEGEQAKRITMFFVGFVALLWKDAIKTLTVVCLISLLCHALRLHISHRLSVNN